MHAVADMLDGRATSYELRATSYETITSSMHTMVESDPLRGERDSTNQQGNAADLPQNACSSFQRQTLSSPLWGSSKRERTPRSLHIALFSTFTWLRDCGKCWKPSFHSCSIVEISKLLGLSSHVYSDDYKPLIRPKFINISFILLWPGILSCTTDQQFLFS